MTNKKPINKTTRTSEAKRKRGGGAKPKHDWEGLRREWLTSGMTKPNFLTLKGINPRSGSTWDATKDWENDLKEVHEKVAAVYLATVEDKRVPEVMDALSGIEKKKIVWSRILNWRADQCEKDWKAADVLRTHCQVFLSAHLRNEVDPENGEERLVTSLRAGELKSIGSCLESIQRVQRLALGMSTDNIGVPPPADDSHTEQDPDDNIPTFEVQMSVNGKFKSLRPRQVR